MTDKTDALAALADGWDEFARGHGIAVNAAYLACAQQLREALAAPAEGDGAVAAAWAEGYASGVTDERTSEANIGIAGFGAKVEPARGNPYTRPAATAVVPEGFVLVPAWKLRRAAEVVNRDGDEHGVGADIEQMLAAAPAAHKGGVVDEAMVRRARTAMAAHPDALHRDMPTVSMLRAALTAALNPEQQPPTEQATRSRLRRVAIEKGEPAPRFDEMGGRDWIDNRDDDDLEAWLGRQAMKALREAKAWVERARRMQPRAKYWTPAVGLLAALVDEIEEAPVGIVEIDAYPWPSIDGADFPEEWEEGQRVRVLAVGEQP